MRFMYFCCWWPVKYIWLILSKICLVRLYLNAVWIFPLDAELTQYENAEDMARPEEERITEAEKNITLQKQLEVKSH